MNIIEQLAQQLAKSEAEVQQFLIDAPKKYKVFTIPKRTHGHRVIAQPSKELKAFQRAFLNIVNFPVHPCSMAYRKGISIKDNALVHNEQRFLLKMDFERFFNSIVPTIFWQACEQLNFQWSADERDQISKLLFWCPSKKTDGKLVLSIGAPSSPSISNFCLIHFDEILQTYCQKQGVYYTRYADDLTFSTNQKGVLSDFPKVVERMVKQLFGHQLRINQSKTAFSSKRHNRHVTGVTITNEATLSLGRERKRYIKHLVHQYTLHKLDKADGYHLQGLLSFAQHIEPTFIEALNRKYTPLIIQQIIETVYGQKAQENPPS